MSRIFHLDVYGTRKNKYETLRTSDLASLDWQEIDPNKPFYLFRPQEQERREEYEQSSWSIAEVFPVNSVGFVTGQDANTITFTQGEANVLAANHNLPETSVRTCLYRPFDTRYIVYDKSIVTRPRAEVMSNMLSGNNIALCTNREVNDAFHHIICTRDIINDCAVSSATRERTYLFALWLYPKEGTLEAAEGRRANLAPAFVAALTERLGGEPPTPEAIFHYAYAVFHAPTYRERYAPFLKIDFPRLPLPPLGDGDDGGSSGDGGAEARAVFRDLAALGERLVALHLLEAPDLARHGVGFPVSGDHTVKKMRVGDRYLPPTADGKPGRVRLNDAEYFDNVPPEAWAFRVGGYQPAAKWLDDRANRALTPADIDHYRRMIAAMRETVGLLAAVDAAFERVIGG